MWTRGSTRPPAAAATSLAFFLAAYVGPLLHQVDHRPDHVHLGDTVVPLPVVEHEHDHPEADHDAAFAIDGHEEAAHADEHGNSHFPEPSDRRGVRGEPAGGFEDLHSHPVEPRTVRIGITASF